MGKIEEVRAEMVAAMKNKDKDRKDIIEECEKRLAVLKEFAPEEMSEEAIRKEISEVLAGLGIEAPTGKDKGRIMKELMPRVKGKADGALVNKIVGEVIQ